MQLGLEASYSLAETLPYCEGRPNYELCHPIISTDTGMTAGCQQHEVCSEHWLRFEDAWALNQWMGGANLGILEINMMDLSTTDNLPVLWVVIYMSFRRRLLSTSWLVGEIPLATPVHAILVPFVWSSTFNCVYTHPAHDPFVHVSRWRTTVARIQNSGLPLCSNIWWWPQVKRQDGPE